jgi:hypothetical protein
MTVEEQERIALGLAGVQYAMFIVAELMFAQGGEYAEHAHELMGARQVINSWLNEMNEIECTIRRDDG